jgi:hypothetical protein
MFYTQNKSLPLHPIFPVSYNSQATIPAAKEKEEEERGMVGVQCTYILAVIAAGRGEGD